MFHEYSQLGGRIRKHYFSPKVFLRLATGQFVPPLHRKNLYGLQYSMLPAQRIGIPELWHRLNMPVNARRPPEQAVPNGFSRRHASNGVARSRG